MGATTKQGRTRNRRDLSKRNPPAGWPPLITWAFESWDGFKVVNFAMENPSYAGWPYGTNFTGDGLVDCWLQDGATFVTATATIIAAGATLRLTFPDDLSEGSLLYVLPWSEGVRGLNGEWLAPMLVNLQL